MRIAPLRLGSSLPLHGIYTLASDLYPLPERLTSGRAVICAELGSIRNEEELFTQIAIAWSFPGYFGHNWDAFEECVRELPAATLYVISGFFELKEHLPEEAQLLQNVIVDSLADHALILALKE
jgi:ribonuclease inhibitor